MTIRSETIDAEIQRLSRTLDEMKATLMEAKSKREYDRLEEGCVALVDMIRALQSLRAQ